MSKLAPMGLRRDDVLGRGLELLNRDPSKIVRPTNVTARFKWST